jgi:hypothetical protein
VGQLHVGNRWMATLPQTEFMMSETNMSQVVIGQKGKNLDLCPRILAFFFAYPIPDEFVKSRKTPFFIIPAEAGIQLNKVVLDPGVRRGDSFGKLLFTKPSTRTSRNQTKIV